MADDDKTLLFGAQKGSAKIKPPYLVIVDGPHKGARFSLQEGANVLGRLEECHVILDDQSVSRKHAELNFLQEGWTLTDLQSKNGTLVNGAPVEEPVVIGHKDLLRLGIYTLRFVVQEMPPEEEMANVPAQDISEWGTVVGEKAPESGVSETAAFPTQGSPEISEEAAGRVSKEVTSPHSPLEDEKKEWLPKARMWVLGIVLFVAALGAGLYFYWEMVLVPGQEAAKKAQDQKKREPVSISMPLGPPEPLKPTSVPVFLDCVANPFPAKIRFQEKDLGQTPLKVNVELEPEKLYDIEGLFEMPELQETFSQRLQFHVASDQSTVPLLFKAPVGTLKVTNLPRDVSMYLEAYFDYNKYQGRPVKLTNLVLNKPIYAPLGRYILELRQAKPIVDQTQLIETIVFRREFFLAEENPAFAIDVTDETLRMFPAEIRSQPTAADVFVDQKKVGQTPFVGMLPVGKHTLTLRKEGYFETSQEIAADINIPLKVEIPLKSSPAGDKINQARARMNQGLYQEALQSLSEVFTLKPTAHETAEAKYLLGRVYIKLGDFSKAQSYFEQAKLVEDFKYWAKLGEAQSLAEQQKIVESLIPLVEVLLNAKEDAVLREGHNLLRQISPLRSVVYIQSDPSGAAVFLNDKRLEQMTPILLHEVGLGSYRIRLEKDGFQSLNLNINLSVNEFNPVLAKLKPLQ